LVFRRSLPFPVKNENVKFSLQLPKETHIHALKDLPPEKQAEVWKEAVETAPEGKITAAHVQSVADLWPP